MGIELKEYYKNVDYYKRNIAKLEADIISAREAMAHEGYTFDSSNIYQEIAYGFDYIGNRRDAALCREFSSEASSMAQNLRNLIQKHSNLVNSYAKYIVDYERNDREADLRLDSIFADEPIIKNAVAYNISGDEMAKLKSTAGDYAVVTFGRSDQRIIDKLLKTASTETERRGVVGYFVATKILQAVIAVQPENAVLAKIGSSEDNFNRVLKAIKERDGYTLKHEYYIFPTFRQLLRLNDVKIAVFEECASPTVQRRINDYLLNSNFKVAIFTQQSKLSSYVDSAGKYIKTPIDLIDITGIIKDRAEDERSRTI